jgi:hypothetical protein
MLEEQVIREICAGTRTHGNVLNDRQKIRSERRCLLVRLRCEFILNRSEILLISIIPSRTTYEIAPLFNRTESVHNLIVVTTIFASMRFFHSFVNETTFYDDPPVTVHNWLSNPFGFYGDVSSISVYSAWIDDSISANCFCIAQLSAKPAVSVASCILFAMFRVSPPRLPRLE